MSTPTSGLDSNVALAVATVMGGAVGAVGVLLATLLGKAREQKQLSEESARKYLVDETLDPFCSLVFFEKLACTARLDRECAPHPQHDGAANTTTGVSDNLAKIPIHRLRRLDPSIHTLCVETVKHVVHMKTHAECIPALRLDRTASPDYIRKQENAVAGDVTYIDTAIAVLTDASTYLSRCRRTLDELPALHKEPEFTRLLFDVCLATRGNGDANTPGRDVARSCSSPTEHYEKIVTRAVVRTSRIAALAVAVTVPMLCYQALHRLSSHWLAPAGTQLNPTWADAIFTRTLSHLLLASAISALAAAMHSVATEAKRVWTGMGLVAALVGAAAVIAACLARTPSPARLIDTIGVFAAGPLGIGGFFLIAASSILSGIGVHLSLIHI